MTEYITRAEMEELVYITRAEMEELVYNTFFKITGTLFIGILCLFATGSTWEQNLGRFLGVMVGTIIFSLKV